MSSVAIISYSVCFKRWQNICVCHTYNGIWNERLSYQFMLSIRGCPLANIEDPSAPLKMIHLFWYPYPVFPYMFRKGQRIKQCLLKSKSSYCCLVTILNLILGHASTLQLVTVISEKSELTYLISLFSKTLTISTSDPNTIPGRFLYIFASLMVTLIHLESWTSDFLKIAETSIPIINGHYSAKECRMVQFTFAKTQIH